MSYQFMPPSSPSLENKVIVMTGGAAGIGAAAIRLLHNAGAHVVFGDVLDEAARALEQELSSGPTVRFVHCDVASYEDNLQLFATAFEAFGRVDHAWSNAGIGEQGNIFDPKLDLDSVKESPIRSLKVLDINLKGPLYFARIASVYLRQNAVDGEDKSLTFTSSVGGFREDPGLWVYVPSKHGVLGLMREIRTPFMRLKPRIRTNAIAPWMTRTRMAEGVQQQWTEAGLPINRAEDIAAVALGVLSDQRLIGATLYVEGGRAWDIEAGLAETRPQWLGERQTADLEKGTQVLGGGEAWIQDPR